MTVKAGAAPRQASWLVAASRIVKATFAVYESPGGITAGSERLACSTETPNQLARQLRISLPAPF